MRLNDKRACVTFSGELVANDTEMWGRSSINLAARHATRHVKCWACSSKANSAFHPSGVGKWVPASAGRQRQVGPRRAATSKNPTTCTLPSDVISHNLIHHRFSTCQAARRVYQPCWSIAAVVIVISTVADADLIDIWIRSASWRHRRSRLTDPQ